MCRLILLAVWVALYFNPVSSEASEWPNDWELQESNDLSVAKRSTCSVSIGGPYYTDMVLTDVQFTVEVTLPPFILLTNNQSHPLPETISYWVWSSGTNIEYGDNDTDSTTDNGWFNGSYSRGNDIESHFLLEIPVTIKSNGHHLVNFIFSTSPDFSANSSYLCYEQHVNYMALPGPLTLLPPLLTAIIAIVFRQVLIALLVGIWLCAFFAYRCNPLVATLRTIDLYFVNSVADFDHAAIAVFSFFLGGLIGVVQKSGGGLGLAALLKRLTGSRRRASLACIILGSMIFFDDYSLVLIAGTSLRTMMKTADVSKEKFAYILKSLGPTLPSLVPISSWIGVQVGNLQTSLKSQFCQKCPEISGADPFVFTVRTIPYRFFPLLLLFSIIVIAILNRDFGPMLTAERISADKARERVRSPDPPRTDDIQHRSSKKKKVLCVDDGGSPDIGRESDEETMEMKGSILSLPTALEHEYTGPLAPKKGIKYRWFNAAIPFLVTMIFTLIGMIVGGYVTIKNLPPEERATTPLTVINIFTKADSVAALIWASTLACAVAMVMLLLPRTLTLQEYMDAWVEGVKDLLEPFMVLWLAWALGEALQDIQTTNYLAKALSEGGVNYRYIPALVTVIGFLMSFAAGSAFGTMGIIFPLVIPTMCKLSNCDEDSVLQSAAAILASSLFGNVISPIAGICILTVFASECDLSAHIKSAALYSLIIAIVSILFGALPVGAGWYPWYAAWIIMAAIMVFIFVVLSSNPDSPTSMSILRRFCPWIYTIPAAGLEKLGLQWRRFVFRTKQWWSAQVETNRFFQALNKICCCCCRRNRNKNKDMEQEPLLS